MSVLKPIFAVALCLGLAACSEEGDTDLLSQAAGAIVGVNTAAPSRQQAPAPEAELLANPGKYMRVNATSAGFADTLVAAGSNGARTTWLGPAGVSVTVEGGVVVATRGLPRDLMGADASDTARALQNGGGTYIRVHDFLDDQDQTATYRLDCALEIKGAEIVSRLGQQTPAIRFEELCRGEGLTFTNVFWMDATRRIIRSQQAVSPDAGYVQVDIY